ncbi:MAG: AbrB family transcriptional regulator [archaeon GW2011_AR18]|nr:MAG: AbrB family transcriptional regulator [archaeon GW2011_AR18]
MEAEIDITTMSSKGQIVIPSSMRKDFEEGEKFIIIKKDKKFILKELKSLSKTLEEDLIFAKRTEEALERHSKGQFKSSTKEDFLKELDKW